jgi:hypothetical protein
MENMKDFLMIVFASFFVMVSPVVPLFFLITSVVILNALVRRWKLKKLKRMNEFRWKLFFGGIFFKSVVFATIMLLIYSIDCIIGRPILQSFESEKFDLMMTRVTAGIIIVSEFISIDRKYTKVTGKSMIKRLKELFKEFKKTKKELME